MTGGDAWDIKDSTVVKSIVPGGINHQKFVGWLDKVSAFISSLQTADNVKVRYFSVHGMKILVVGFGGVSSYVLPMNIKLYGK